MNKDENKVVNDKQCEEEKKPVYVSPEITSYTSEEIIEKIGPAVACSGTPTCTIGP